MGATYRQACELMKLALRAINDLEREGLIHGQAIGGAMGATYYLEPVSAFDLDIFVLFQTQEPIRTLTPIHDFLRARGHLPKGDAVVIGDWPVQFLPAETPLLREAVEQARALDYQGVPIRVMSAEHLMAIAVQTGSAEDHRRLVAFVESAVADRLRLRDILSRHALTAAWKRFESRYP